MDFWSQRRVSVCSRVMDDGGYGIKSRSTMLIPCTLSPPSIATAQPASRSRPLPSPATQPRADAMSAKAFGARKMNSPATVDSDKMVAEPRVRGVRRCIAV